MSGSGGYYKYRCKYWLTYNCPNWVWVNNAPCASCLAEGRESKAASKSSRLRIPREIHVPQLENGFLQYTTMEVIAADGAHRAWAIRSLDDLPTTQLDTPTSGLAASTFAAIHAINVQRLKDGEALNDTDGAE